MKALRFAAVSIAMSCCAAPSFAATVIVEDFAELVSALGAANTGDIILLENGTYTIQDTWAIEIYTNDLTIGSLSGNRDAVIVEGWGMYGSDHNGFFVGANNVTIQDMTIRNVRWHAIQTDVNTDNVHIRNCVFQDTGEQMVKVPYSASIPDRSENGVIENCLFEYTAGIGPRDYIGGIDVHFGSNWIVRNNTFRDIQSPGGGLAEHAIHFWTDSQNTLVEGNLIINCDRGVGFGLGSVPHSGGIIRNNMIYHDEPDIFADVGIGLETASDAAVYNNTIYYAHNAYPNAIEYRFSGTYGAYIANNLTNKGITSRDGGSGTVEYNVTNAQASWFVAPASGNLHLAWTIPTVVDQGTAIAGLTDDFDGDARPQGAGIDIGADELKVETYVVDFDGDQIPDILWRQPSTGKNVIWYMANNGRTLKSAAWAPTVAAGWEACGVEYFDGDGVPDILWRQPSTGKNVIWYMANNGRTSKSAAWAPTVATDWEVGGVANFDRDGVPDILWRQPSTGKNAIWYMASNGRTLKSSAWAPTVATDWEVGGVADFDRDGVPDILWRQPSTGKNAIWYMASNGTAVRSSAWAPTVDTSWIVGKVADFDRDGVPDILWRQPSTGKNAIWYMASNGTVVRSSAWAPTADTSWIIGG